MSSTLTSSSSPLAIPEHAYYCFQVLESALSRSKHGHQRHVDEDIPFEDSDELVPLFVTWDKYTHPLPPATSYRITSSTTTTPSSTSNPSTTSLSSCPSSKAILYNPLDAISAEQPDDKSSEEPHLRGCIGTFTGMKLSEGLRDYALTAALHDTRFHPIGIKELPLLRCGVSLLTPFEPISSPLDWSLSIHGIHISFPSPSASLLRSRTYTATYLPHVASHQGWSKLETILSLIRKSGYSNWRDVKEGDEVWNSLKVRRYESRKVEVEWGEYKLWKEETGRK